MESELRQKVCFGLIWGSMLKVSEIFNLSHAEPSVATIPEKYPLPLVGKSLSEPSHGWLQSSKPLPESLGGKYEVEFLKIM